jgi:hypothetical protein
MTIAFTPIVFPNQSGTTITITNGDDNSWTMTNSGSTQNGGNLFSDVLDQGKKYIEVRVDQSSTMTFMLGIASSSLSSSAAGWNTGDNYLIYGGNGNIYPGNISAFSSLSVNDIIRIAYDTNTGEIWFNKNNGSWYPNSPSSNSSLTVASGSVKLTVGEANSNAPRTHSFTALTAANMVYSPPSGFTAH